MYAYVKGIMVHKSHDRIILEAGGIGYRIFCPALLQVRLPAVGEEAKVYTYHDVREGIFALYGFPTPEEHDLFTMLLQVSGIGPKVAGSMVAQIPPSTFALAVVTNDVERLTRVKGIGTKGAQRMIVELKDKLKGVNFTVKPSSSGEPSDDILGEDKLISEAVSALVVLGYSPTDARQAVMGAFKQTSSIEDLIRLALKAMAQA